MPAPTTMDRSPRPNRPMLPCLVLFSVCFDSPLWSHTRTDLKGWRTPYVVRSSPLRRRVSVLPCLARLFVGFFDFSTSTHTYKYSINPLPACIGQIASFCHYHRRWTSSALYALWPLALATLAIQPGRLPGLVRPSPQPINPSRAYNKVHSRHALGANCACRPLTPKECKDLLAQRRARMPFLFPTTSPPKRREGDRGQEPATAKKRPE